MAQAKSKLFYYVPFTVKVILGQPHSIPICGNPHRGDSLCFYAIPDNHKATKHFHIMHGQYIKEEVICYV